jgi:ferredoxin
MAKIIVKNDGVTFEVPDGERLLPYLKEYSNLPFGCENGKCGRCACVILSGSENLNIKTRQEEETLAKIGAPSSKRNRLACQLSANSGTVELEY